MFSLTAAAACNAQSTIHVLADQPTIQTAINAADNGDTVLAVPGTYSENINFNGKAITVTSSNGPFFEQVYHSQWIPECVRTGTSLAEQTGGAHTPTQQAEN